MYPMSMGKIRQSGSKRKRQKALAVCLFPALLIFMLMVFSKSVQASDSRIVKVAFFPMAGYHEKMPDGSYSGMDVEYLEAVCKYVDWEIEYVECDSWEDALRMLENKEVDLVGSAQYSKKRASVYQYASLSSGYTFGVIAVNADSSLAYEDFDAMQDISFGMVEGYIRKKEFIQYLSDNGVKGPHILEYAHTEQLLEAMKAGQVDAMVHTFTEVVEGQRLVGRFAPMPFYYITYQGNDDLMNELDEAVSSLKMEQPALESELMNTYFYNKLDGTVLLTSEEKEYIEQAKNVTVGYLDGYYPFSFEEEGEFKGLTRDMLEEKVVSIGIPLSYHKFDNQREAIEELKNGTVDLLAYCMDKETIHDDARLRVLKEYAKIPVVLVTKKEMPYSMIQKIATVSYLEQEAGDALDLSSVSMYRYMTQRESVAAVKDGLVDAALCDGYLVEHLLRTDSKYNDLEVQNVLSGEHSVVMAIREDEEPLLASVLAKSVSEIDAQMVNEYTLKENAYSLLSIREFISNYSIFIILFMLVVTVVVIFVTMHLVHDSREIQKLMYKDAVMDIWNLNYLFFHGEHKLLPEQKSPYAVVILQVIQLRQYNVIYGWDAGEKVLQHIADALKQNIDAENECYAINQGDRFVLLLNWGNYDDLQNRLIDLKKTVEGCILSNTENRMTVQLGVYPIPQDSGDLHLAVNYASQALDCVNDSDITDIRFYDDALAGEIKERHKREKLLETVDIEKNFVAFYQPKVDIRNNKIVGAEALVRFKDPTADGAIRSPAFFVPYFEQTGRILEIDFFVLESACKLLRRRMDEGKPVVTISCNFSRKHFMKAGFPEHFEEVLEKYHIPKGLIEVEITETMVVEEAQHRRVKKTLDRLRNDGIRLSIDDFGAGYSSLGIFEQIPASVIKLDRSFLLNQEDRERQVKIMRGIVRISEELNAQVVCEGVETTEDISLMKEIGAYVAQGYFYSKPVPEEEFEAKLSE